MHRISISAKLAYRIDTNYTRARRCRRQPSTQVMLLPFLVCDTRERTRATFSYRRLRRASSYARQSSVTFTIHHDH